MGCNTWASAYTYTIVNTHTSPITCAIPSTSSGLPDTFGSFTVKGNSNAKFTVGGKYSKVRFLYIFCMSKQPFWTQAAFPFDTTEMPPGNLTLKFSYGPGMYDASLRLVK